LLQSRRPVDLRGYRGLDGGRRAQDRQKTLAALAPMRLFRRRSASILTMKGGLGVPAGGIVALMARRSYNAPWCWAQRRRHMALWITANAGARHAAAQRLHV